MNPWLGVVSSPACRRRGAPKIEGRSRERALSGSDAASRITGEILDVNGGALIDQTGIQCQIPKFK